MPAEPVDLGFIERFERAMDGTDCRLRDIESGHAAMKQEMKSLKEDRCNKNEKYIDELFKSRNELERTVDQLKGTSTGLAKICENLDRTVETLDKKSLLLGEGKKSIAYQLESISKWNAPSRIQNLETQVKDLEEAGDERRGVVKDYRLLFWGALLGSVFSVIASLAVYFLTK